MQRARILLADDHTLVAHALANSIRTEFDLIGIVDDGQKLLQAARESQPDIILSDITMPLLSGLEALRLLRAEQIPAKVIFLTMHADPGLACEALRAGASGFLLKNAAGDELLNAIRAVQAGRIYLSPSIEKQTIEQLALSDRRHSETLTPRQRDVLRLIAGGLNVKQIAAQLELSPRTVETHKYDMMQTLGMQSTAELVRYAVRCGLVSA